MKLNKNKVLSALTAKEESLKKALVAAKAEDQADLIQLVKVHYVNKLHEYILENEKSLERIQKEISSLKASAKAAAKCKPADLPGFVNKARNIVSWRMPYKAREIQQQLEAVQRQKALAKLSDGETIDSRSINLDLEVL